MVKYPNNRLSCLVVWAGVELVSASNYADCMNRQTTEPTEPATERQDEPIELHEP